MSDLSQFINLVTLPHHNRLLLHSFVVDSL
jgi:hypothetical protein